MSILWCILALFSVCRCVAHLQGGVAQARLQIASAIMQHFEERQAGQQPSGCVDDADGTPETPLNSRPLEGQEKDVEVEELTRSIAVEDVDDDTCSMLPCQQSLALPRRLSVALV